MNNHIEKELKKWIVYNEALIRGYKYSNAEKFCSEIAEKRMINTSLQTILNGECLTYIKRFNQDYNKMLFKQKKA